MALLLAICMVCSMSPPIMAAEASMSDSGNVVLLGGFAALADEVREQSVPIGTSSVELNLPDTLEATMYSVSEDTAPVTPAEPSKPEPTEPEEETPPIIGESEPAPAPSQPQDSGEVEEPAPPADEPESTDGGETITQVLSAYVQSDITQADEDTTTPAAVTVQGVTWESDPAYDGDTEGEYLFTAVLPEGYTVGGGASLPTITVTVGQTAPKAQVFALGNPAELDEKLCFELFKYKLDDVNSTAVVVTLNHAYLPNLAERDFTVPAQVKSGDKVYAVKAIKDIPGESNYTTPYDYYVFKLTLSEGIETIDDGCFHPEYSSNSQLTFSELNLPLTFRSQKEDGVKNPLYRVFKNVKYITVPEGHPDFTSEGGVLYNKDKSQLLCYPTADNTTAESFTIPESVTEIVDYAFEMNAENTRGLKKIIGTKVEKIGKQAFYIFSALEEVDFPLVTEIGEQAFFRCGLKKISFPKLTTLGKGVFDSCAITEFSAETDMPLIRVLPEYTFKGCRKLTKVDLGEITKVDGGAFFSTGSNAQGAALEIEMLKVTTIENEVFSYSNVTTLNAPLVTELPRGTLSNCAKLTGVPFPLVTKVGPRAFEDCKSLTEIDLPSVTEIETYAFTKCTALATLGVPAASPPSVTGTENFYQCSKANPLRYLDESGNAITDEDAIKEAANLYKAVNDGDTTDKGWYGWSTEPPDAVTNFDLTDNLVAPVIGVYAQNYLTDDDQYTGSARWSPWVGQFENKVYTATVTLTAEQGYTFTGVAQDSFTHTGATSVTNPAGSGNTMVVTIVFPVAAKPAGPAVTGVAAVNCTDESNNDGKLTGVTAAMEYKKSDATNYTPGTGSTITGLVPGEYLVRVKETTTHSAGANSSFTVAAYSPTPTYKINLDKTGTYPFTGAEFGYGAQTPLTVTVSNAGNQATGALTAALSGANPGSFALSPANIGSIAVNGSATFTVTPNTGLAAGTYTATVTVSGGNSITAGFNVSFTVTAVATVPVTGVTVAPGTATIEAGKTQQLTASVAPENATTKAVTWASDKTAIATVDASGLVTAVAEGTATITATAKDGSGKIGSCAVTITPKVLLDGTKNPDYITSKVELDKIHIITNVTPTLADVTLPANWSFTGDKTAKLVANNNNSGNQSFAVKYTSLNPNYADVNIAAQPFPVSTVAVTMSKLEVVTIDTIGGTESLSATVTVTGAALTGDLALTGMEWRSSCPEIVSLSNVSMGGTASVTAKGDAKGVSMVGVAYKNGGMLGYVLVKVIDNRDDSANTIDQIKDITDTLDKLVDKDNPTAGDKGAVNAVADEVTKLPEAAKEALTKENVESLDDLKKSVNNTLTITIDETPEGTAPPAPTGVTAVGTAIACGVDSGTVTYYVTPVAPTAADIKMELKLDMAVDSAKGKQLQAPLFFTMTLPSGVDTSKLTIKHIKDGGATETVAFTNSGQTVSFKLSSFSDLQFVVASGSTPPPPPSGGDSSGSGNSDDGQYDFWEKVKDKINNADDGDTIKVNAKDYDKMPESVMDTLRKNPDITIVIDWNGGEPITIPAGKAQPKEQGRIYWPLSLLAELYKGIKFVETPIGNKTNPETGGPGYIEYADGKQIPVTGGVKQMDAPEIAGVPGAITPNTPAIVTPPTAGFEADAFAGTPDASTASGINCNLCHICPTFLGICLFIWLTIIVLASIGGIFLWKKRLTGKQGDN